MTFIRVVAASFLMALAMLLMLIAKVVNVALGLVALLISWCFGLVLPEQYRYHARKEHSIDA